MRKAFFSNGLCFSQVITEWQPHERYSFTFRPDPGFRAAYILDLSSGPFQMKAGSYHIIPRQHGVSLSLTSLYELRSFFRAGLFVPVRVVMIQFQRYLLSGIKANAEREALAGAGLSKSSHA